MSSTEAVMANLAFDALGSLLKLAWRALAAFGVFKAVTAALEKPGAAKLKEAVRGVLQPGKVKAEKEAAREATEKKESEERRAATAKEAKEEMEAERLAALQFEAKRMQQEKEAEEAAAIANAKRLAERETVMEERKKAKEAEEEKRVATELARKEHMRKVREAFNKKAEEEKAAAEAARIAAEEKAAAEAAAIEAAKTPEQRAAEAAAKAAEEAERAAQLQREREEREAAEAAAAELRAAALEARKGGGKAAEREPVGAGYVRASPASEDSVLSLLQTAAVSVAQQRVLSTSDLHGDMRNALTESLAELQGGYALPEADDLRGELLGFWKLLVTSDDEQADDGATGCGAPWNRQVLGSYACFSEPDEYGGAPTLQLVEVVSDCKVGRAAVAALKGDFYLGKLASTGALGVVEDFTKLEYADQQIKGPSELEPGRWSCSYLGPKIRVATTEDGHTRVYSKSDAGAAQAEIAEMLATEVEVVEADEEDEVDEVDDRPLWQKRLDEENAKDGSYDRFGPPGQSDIP